MLIEITELCKIYQLRPRSDILKLETPIKMLYATMPQKEMLMDTSLLLRRWNDSYDERLCVGMTKAYV